MDERRIRRTKNAFKTHLISLVKQKGYTAVTVTDIVEQADYNRSTFYAYYLDKEDLANQLVQEMMQALRHSFQKPFDLDEIIYYREIENHVQNTFFQHIYDNRHFYELLVLPNTIPNLKQDFLENFTEIFSSIRYLDEANNIITLEHFNTYKMYGSYGVILEWIADGCREQPEQLSAHLLSIFLTTPHSFRFI